ncbi:MAG TPA: hypothetical protein VM935_19780 [Chitinophagaceae bacterium]|nr:hypothetical protein [Chitinophagaceae bacterium]
MTDKSKHIDTYKAEDFERYYAGKMTPAEMHQLEKSALDDPFLQDALDGYQVTKSGVSDSEELRQRLLQKTERGKVIPLIRYSVGIKYWKVAAMVVLTAGVGWLVYNLGFDTVSKDIAVAEKRTYTSPITADSAKDAVEATGDTIATEPANDVAMATAPVASKPAYKEKVSIGSRSDAAQNKRENPAAISEANPETKKEVQSGVLQQQEVAAPEALFKNGDTAVVAGYGTQRKMRATQDNTMVLKKIKKGTMEEVTVGRSRDTSNNRRHQISFEEVVPKDGQTYYNNYVAQNIQEPLGKELRLTGGEVQLSFDVNRKGQPVNIKVEKSLCKSCDEEAVRLLKEGPGWIQKKKTRKGKFRISF